LAQTGAVSRSTASDNPNSPSAICLLFPEHPAPDPYAHI